VYCKNGLCFLSPATADGTSEELVHGTLEECTASDQGIQTIPKLSLEIPLFARLNIVWAIGACIHIN
jgi:hypothetical protein